jgi:hypothetical protein
MPEGSPIDQWWKSHLPAKVTTSNDAERVCLIVPPKLSPYCGRRKRVKITFDPAEAKCSECTAAWNTDHQFGSTT